MKDQTPDNHTQIVIVDDTEIMLGVLASAMKSLGGIECHGFLDAVEAYEFVAQDPKSIGLIVTDFRMPGMSGLELARKVHALDPGMPIICVSGFVYEGFPQDEFKVVLEKPFDLGDFHAAVLNHMRVALPLHPHTDHQRKRA